MNIARRNQRILFAYALLFTVAAGVVILDPVQRAKHAQLADVPIPPLPQEIAPSTPPVGDVRLAVQFPPRPAGSPGAAQR